MRARAARPWWLRLSSWCGRRGAWVYLGGGQAIGQGRDGRSVARKLTTSFIPIVKTGLACKHQQPNEH